ncbi:hypothetical protein GOP47_0030770, partial [Adiantum capillus-veneris]
MVGVGKNMDLLRSIMRRKYGFCPDEYESSTEEIMLSPGSPSCYSPVADPAILKAGCNLECDVSEERVVRRKRNRVGSASEAVQVVANHEETMKEKLKQAGSIMIAEDQRHVELESSGAAIDVKKGPEGARTLEIRCKTAGTGKGAEATGSMCAATNVMTNEETVYQRASLMEYMRLEHMQKHLALARPKGDPRKTCPSILYLIQDKICSVCGEEDLQFSPPPMFCEECRNEVRMGIDEYYITGKADVNISINTSRRLGNRSRKASTSVASSALPVTADKEVDEGKLVSDKNNIAAPQIVLCKPCFQEVGKNEIVEVGVTGLQLHTGQFQYCGPEVEITVHQEAELNVGDKTLYNCPDCCVQLKSSTEQRPAAVGGGSESVIQTDEQDIPADTTGNIMQYYKWRAKSLPTTSLSDHIENRLASRLTQERAERAAAAVRSSSDPLQ